MLKPEKNSSGANTSGDEIVVIDRVPMLASLVNNPGERFRPAHLNFDCGNLEGWSALRLVSSYSAMVQSEVVRIGRYAVRCELRKNDYISQGARAELRDWLNAPLEKEIWYGFSTLIPQGFPIDEGVGCVLAQWHDQARKGDPSGKPPIAIRYKEGRLFITGAYSPVASPDPQARYEFYSHDDFPTGVWHDFIFRVFWSQHGDSEIEAWLNTEKMFTYRGKLGYENESIGPYFKMGMYCHGPLEMPHIVYHDNYSRGHSYLEVDPSFLHESTGA